MIRLDKSGKIRLSEADVQRQCVDLMESHGWRMIRTGYGEIHRNGRRVECYGEIGMPDYLAIYYTDYGAAAKVVWIEFKRPKARGVRGGKRSADQTLWRDVERKRGAIVLQIDSLEQLIREIAKL
jgi:very-short-patch-repair endonuclease